MPASMKLSGMESSETRLSIATILLIFFLARIFTEEKKKKKIVLCGVKLIGLFGKLDDKSLKLGVMRANYCQIFFCSVPPAALQWY